jgi:hypothetical protein
MAACPPPQTLNECQQREAAAATQAQQQQEAEAQRQASAIAMLQNDTARGYRHISVEIFILDGRDLAGRTTNVSLSGSYKREGNFDVLYANEAAFIRNPQNAPTVQLLTDGAEREFRQHLLSCQAKQPFPCYVTVLGRVTMCTLTNTFGVKREMPCVDVREGREAHLWQH